MFNYKSLEELRKHCEAARLDIPLAEDVQHLRKPLRAGPLSMRNRLAIQPMEGCDGTRGGKPDKLTVRRYERFAKSGAGLLWFEATAIAHAGRANPRQLLINEENLDSLKEILAMIKETAVKAHGFAPPVIMQATHSGRYSRPGFPAAGDVPAPLAAYLNPNPPFKLTNEKARVVTDDELKLLEERYGAAARLAARAGFDGIDIKACHGYLNCELLSAFTRPGNYGGSFENRTRFFVNSVMAAKAAAPSDFLITTRMNLYDGLAYPHGFGMDESGDLAENTEEPLRLVKILHKQLGMPMINATMGNPYANPHVNRPFDQGFYEPPEAPLAGVARMYRITKRVQQAFPALAVMASAPTYLRQFGANLAAGAIGEGCCKLVGFGRQAFAYPDFIDDCLHGRVDPGKCCVTCGKCTELMRAGSTAGCVVRDGIYREIYRSDVK